MSQTIQYVSAPAGSGKTYGTAIYAVQLASTGSKILIVQPTKELIKETVAAIRNIDPTVRVKAIHSTAFRRKSVLELVTAHMQASPPEEGEVLIVTHEILPRLTQSHRATWHLIVDEMPSGFDVFNLQIAVTHKHATTHFELEDFHGGSSVVKAKDVAALRALAKNPTGDAGLAVFKDLAEAVLNDDKIVCVETDAYEKLVAPKGREKLVSFFSILRPSFVAGYASVTIMGANLEQTELFMLWDKVMDVDWVRHPVLSANLRYIEHKNGERLTIKYLIDGNWSKHHASKQHDDDSSVLDEVARIVENEFGPTFLWQANVEVPDSQFSFGARLPTKAHGLNKPAFQQSNEVALLMAMNHRNTALSFLKTLGFTDDEVKTMMQYQNEYQAMMRCSLRDPNATDPVTVIVVSKGSADWLRKLFPDCKVEWLENTITEPAKSGPSTEGKVAMSSTERSRKRRQQEREHAKRLKQARS